MLMILFRYSTLTRVIYFGESMDYYKSRRPDAPVLPFPPPIAQQSAYTS